MKILLFLILVLLNCKSTQDYKPIENPEVKAFIKKWIVTPDSGLNLRDAPSRKAKSIRLLLRGTMVSHKQLPENEKPDTIEDQKGKWLKVEVGNEFGWVFDVYLSEPVFSPSGDKFYFYTIKDPITKKIISSRNDFYCRHEYADLEKLCKIEIRNKENTEILKEIKRENIISWYDDNSVISFSSLFDGGQSMFAYHIINIDKLDMTLLYDFFKQVFPGDRNKYYTEKNEICIFDKCLFLERKEVILNIIIYDSKIRNENYYTAPKEVVKKFSIRRNQDFTIKELTQEEILKLKQPYTGYIEFSVDKRNYLLHVPTGKITEVKEK